VDANGLVPMRAAPRAFPAARSFRLFLQRELPRLFALPAADPLDGLGRARGAEVPGPLLVSALSHPELRASREARSMQPRRPGGRP